MGGWNLLLPTTHPVGTADADNPTEAKVARRRQSDLNFLAWVKTADKAELKVAKSVAKGWRLVAIDRRLNTV